MTEAILAFAFIVGLSLFGGDSGTTVILLPDESGQVGAVTVSTADDSRVLNQTYNAVTAKEDATRLGETQTLTEAQAEGSTTEAIQLYPLLCCRVVRADRRIPCNRPPDRRQDKRAGGNRSPHHRTYGYDGIG